MAQVSVHVLYGDIVRYSDFDGGFEGNEYLYRKNATGTKPKIKAVVVAGDMELAAGGGHFHIQGYQQGS